MLKEHLPFSFSPPSLEVSLSSFSPSSSYFSLTIFLLCQLRIQSLHSQVNTERRKRKKTRIRSIFLSLSPFRLHENKMGNEEVDEREVGISCLERNGSHSLSISDEIISILKERILTLSSLSHSFSLQEKEKERKNERERMKKW